ncbi:MAG: hypothetical protein KDD78_19080, partial [Caldilineaceae bacterium]|nr:hypothetical protein [Caldilineaceae bacterium]
RAGSYWRWRMTNLTLQITLRSDGAFGRGDGVAGLIDAEVQHDEYGFPYIGGRTLKGLLVEECANLLFALDRAGLAGSSVNTANDLFGTPGSGLDDFARLRIGPAELSASLRAVVREEYVGRRAEVMRDEILPALTAIRRQTAVDATTGAPKQETLRTQRVVLRNTQLKAPIGLDPDTNPDNETDRRLLGLLAACVLALRRGGTDRNRGRGELTARLFSGDEDVTTTWFDAYFAKEVPA